MENLKISLKLEYGVSKKVILQLVKLGFLEKDILYSCDERKTAFINKNKIKSFNIPTSSRPEQLAKCIKSFSDNFEKNSHYIDYYVFDDTPITVNNENYFTLRELSKDIKTNIFYIDLEEKKRFIDVLSKESGVEKELIEFGFMPNKYINNKENFIAGANRNFILAYTIGECFFTADDDSCCLGFENDISPEIYFSKGRGNIIKEPIDVSKLKSSARELNKDIFQAHEKYIGETLEDVLCNKKIKDIDCNIIGEDNEVFPKNYNFYKDSKVHFTFNTMFGWPDQTSDEVLYEYLNSKNLELLFGRGNNMICENTKVDTIYSSPFLLTTTLTAIDNRNSICPFIPIYKNEDVHYSYLLNYLDPYSLSACINTSLLHDKKKTTNQLDSFYKNFYGEIVFSHVLYIILNTLKIKIPNKYLDISLRKKIFADTIKEICGKDKNQFIKNLLDLKIDLEKLWTEKSQLINNIYISIPEDEIFIEINENLKSFDKFLNAEEWELISKVLVSYSNLLLQWDNIMETCSRLKAQGRLPRKKI